MTSALYLLLAGLPAFLLFGSLLGRRKLRSIPTIGGSNLPLLSYLGALNFARNGPALLQEGYDKFKGGVFKVATLERWVVVVTGSKLVDELQRLPAEKASLNKGAAELIHTKWMFGQVFHDNPYHIGVIRQQLTRHISAAFPDIQDETELAFEELVPATTNGEWSSVPALSVVRQIVARVSGRMFVGLPYCRNKEYLQLSINFTEDVDLGTQFLPFVPRPFKSLVARYVTNISRRIDSCEEYLHELLHTRVRDMERSGGDWADKPDDLLQWLIDEEMKTGKLDVRNIVRMILFFNFAAISTSANSLTHALYHLAANPELADPLREEMEAVLRKDGYTKTAMGKLRRFDSFLRESLRYNGITAFSLMRKILQDIHLSDGTFIPAETIVIVPSTATQLDEANYPNAGAFDPWRFYDMREEDDNSLKFQYTNTALDYISFGHGKHACPGRFFASAELKAMMVHLVMNYDVKLSEEGVRPQNKWVGLVVFPDPSAEVLFRRRVHSPVLKIG